MTHHVSKGTFCWHACSVYWDTSHECSSTRPDVFRLPFVCRHGWMSETWVRFPSIAEDFLRQTSGPDRRPTASPIIYLAPGVPFCDSNSRVVKLVTDFHLVNRSRMRGVYRTSRTGDDASTGTNLPSSLLQWQSRRTPLPLCVPCSVRQWKVLRHTVLRYSLHRKTACSALTQCIFGCAASNCKSITFAVTCVSGLLLYLPTKCTI
jgi:hypothetical protein